MKMDLDRLPVFPRVLKSVVRHLKNTGQSVNVHERECVLLVFGPGARFLNLDQFTSSVLLLEFNLDFNST